MGYAVLARLALPPRIRLSYQTPRKALFTFHGERRPKQGAGMDEHGAWFVPETRLMQGGARLTLDQC